MHIKEKDSFYQLIDRLQACRLKNNPERRAWDNDEYYGVAFTWIGKEAELLQRVLDLENGNRIVIDGIGITQTTKA